MSNERGEVAKMKEEKKTGKGLNYEICNYDYYHQSIILIHKQNYKDQSIIIISHSFLLHLIFEMFLIFIFKCLIYRARADVKRPKRNTVATSKNSKSNSIQFSLKLCPCSAELNLYLIPPTTNSSP